jgi:hypothetical protein
MIWRVGCLHDNEGNVGQVCPVRLLVDRTLIEFRILG